MGILSIIFGCFDDKQKDASNSNPVKNGSSSEVNRV